MIEHCLESGEECVLINTQRHETYISSVQQHIKEKPAALQDIWVTKRLAFGPYPTHPEYLVREGFTHLLNVAEPYKNKHLSCLFYKATSVSLEDFKPISLPSAQRALFHIHTFLHTCQEAKVYVHCAAGQHRSPTIILLYLVSLGLPPADGIELLSKTHVDSVPGHPKLIHSPLYSAMHAFGQEHLREFRSSILEF